MVYLAVKNWDKFQHYRDRRPVWVKYHVELLDDYTLTGLPIPAQLLYDRLLLLAAKTDNRIPNDPAWIGGQTRLAPKVVRTAIGQLTETGFLVEHTATKRLDQPEHPASNGLALARSREEETETEVETEKEKASTGAFALPVARPPGKAPENASVRNLITRSLRSNP